jgi:hypothetical protein
VVQKKPLNYHTLDQKLPTTVGAGEDLKKPKSAKKSEINGQKSQVNGQTFEEKVTKGA